MADFYDYLDDLDLDFDPDDPTDPLNALLEQIREDMEVTSMPCIFGRQPQEVYDRI